MSDPLQEPLLWSATAAPRQQSAARQTGDAPSNEGLTDEGSTNDTSPSGLTVCPAPPPGPPSRTPSPTTTTTGPHHHHTSVTRPPKEVFQPPPPETAASLVAADIDFSSPEGNILAQLAGGVWISQITSKLWPQLSESLEAAVREMVPSLVEANKPAWLEGVTLDRFKLGPHPPVVRSVHVDAVDDDSVPEIRLRLEVSWDSQSDVQLTVQMLPSSIAKMLPSVLQGVANWVTSLTAGVQHLALRAQVLLTLGPLSSTGSVVKEAQLSLLRTPDIDFTITVTKGESRVLNIVKPWLRTTIASAFGPFVLPEHMSFPIEPGMPDVHKPEGILLVRVVKATGVPKMDYWGHSDTYVDAWVRGRIKRRTPVIKNSAEPVWDADKASFKFLVHTKQYQVLSFELWDEDKELLDAGDDIIGGASVRLADLPPGEEQELTLQVTNAATGGTTGDDAPPGIDPAYSGGHSRVDVSNTRLHVLVKYVPARMVPQLVEEVGSPGTLVMKLTKITVPNLELLPLKVRPSVTGQEPTSAPPLSARVTPLQGRDPVTGEDRKDRKDIPFMYNAVWDVLGSAAEVEDATFVLEMVTDAGVPEELMVSRVEVPVSAIMNRKIAAFPEGGGGTYTLHSATNFEFEVELLWFPLLDTRTQAAATSDQAAKGVGLQGLIQDMAQSALASIGTSTLTPDTAADNDNAKTTNDTESTVPAAEEPAGHAGVDTGDVAAAGDTSGAMAPKRQADLVTPDLAPAPA